MKRKQQHEKRSHTGLHSLPWELITLCIVPRIDYHELRAWSLLQRISLLWRILVDQYLKDDAVLLPLLPRTLGKREPFTWTNHRCDMGRDILGARAQLRMAACSARLFAALAADEWLQRMRETICGKEYYKIPKEALSLLPSHQTRGFGVRTHDLSTCAPHLQLGHLLRHSSLYALTSENVYAVTRVWTEHSPCGRVFVYQKPQKALVRAQDDAYVCDKHGKTLYLADLCPLMDSERTAHADCYELLVPASTSRVHLQHGQQLLETLTRHFQLLYPALREMVTEFGAMSAPPETGKK